LTGREEQPWSNDSATMHRRRLTAKRLDWRREGDELVKVVRKGNFAGALAYVNAVGALAEAADHHPDIDIRWTP